MLFRNVKRETFCQRTGKAANRLWCSTNYYDGWPWLARDAQEAGASGLLLAPVSYAPLTDEEVFQHFGAVVEAGRLLMCIYNNPRTTRFTFSHVS